MASKYAELNTQQLVEEIKQRREKGSNIAVDLRSGQDKLVAALEMDDVESGTEIPAFDAAKVNPAQPQPPAQPKPLTGELDNQVPLQPEMPTTATQPHPDLFAKGHKARHKGDGYIYQVIKTDDETKPYKARVPKQASGHSGLFWEGSEQEYKDTFDKI